MISLEDIDNSIKALQDMLQVWDTEELKRLLCDALDMRALILLNQNLESEKNNNDLLN